MKRQVMYTGMISTVLSVALAGAAYAEPAKGGTGTAPEADSTMYGRGSGPLADTPTPQDKRTDLTPGTQGSIPDEYATTPVRQGKLSEVTDSKWLQKPVKGMQGDVVGKIKQVLKDQTTGQIEYVILVPNDSKTAVPLRWSQFEEKNDQLQLKMKKEDLKTALNSTSAKDMSPDLEEYMTQIDQVRSAPKASKSSGSATSSPPVGPHGEVDTTKGGAGGSQALPEGKAPGFEGGQPSSKR
jgi:sporulation protein YlmC with PRC-barrel domain